MMKTIDDLHDGIVGIEAHGRVTGQDYEMVLIPTVERALQAHPSLRLLYCVAPDFTGFTGAALWDDARIGLRHLHEWERIAIVTDVRWIGAVAKAFRFFLAARTKVFRNEEIQAAKDWLRAAAA